MNNNDYKQQLKIFTISDHLVTISLYKKMFENLHS